MTGSEKARNLPIGWDTRRRTIGFKYGAGSRKLKNMLKALKRSDVSAFAGSMNEAHPPTEERDIPISHMRIVITYMLGSSLLDTEALTSGKGLSCSKPTKLSSILGGEKENELLWVSGVEMEVKVDKEWMEGCVKGCFSWILPDRRAHLHKRKENKGNTTLTGQ